MHNLYSIHHHPSAIVHTQWALWALSFAETSSVQLAGTLVNAASVSARQSADRRSRSSVVGSQRDDRLFCGRRTSEIVSITP